MKRKKSQTTKNTQPKRKINNIEMAQPSMADMDNALQDFIKNGSPLHLFIFGETGTRSWTFDPTNFRNNINEDKQVELDLISKGFPIPTNLGDMINLIGHYLDHDNDEKFSIGSSLNQYLGYCALKQFLTTETYKSGMVFNMNTGAISYLRMKPAGSTLFDYQSRFHGMTNGNGTTLELTKQAFGFETKILFRVHKNEYKYSPMAKIIMA